MPNPLQTNTFKKKKHKEELRVFFVRSRKTLVALGVWRQVLLALFFLCVHVVVVYPPVCNPNIFEVFAMQAFSSACQGTWQNKFAPSGLLGTQAALEHYIQNQFPAKGGKGVEERGREERRESVDKPNKHKSCGFKEALLCSASTTKSRQMNYDNKLVST